ncbi:hypothetical protein [Escherichia coli]|uniref:hypothetical protein n=1 Tax=Escherichia coli TaxID=562 RepID=UPI0012FDD229|nr:hypothetical protein [Escherichia coli]QGY13405.1 hypothetical protein F6P95_16900 [Escherichia coli]
MRRSIQLSAVCQHILQLSQFPCTAVLGRMKQALNGAFSAARQMVATAFGFRCVLIAFSTGW